MGLALISLHIHGIPATRLGGGRSQGRASPHPGHPHQGCDPLHGGGV